MSRRRLRSSAPLMSGAACVLLAAGAGVGPAHAECISQLNQQPPDGVHWRLHFDRASRTRCWILVDAAGREVVLPPPPPQQPPTTSAFQSFLGNFTGAGPPPPPPPPLQPEAAVAPAPSPSPVRRPRVVNVKHRPVAPPAADPKADAHPAKHEMSQSDRDALFEEFLRWHEGQKITGTK